MSKKARKKKKRSSVYRKMKKQFEYPSEESEPLKIELVEFPDVLPPEMSREERFELVKEMAKKAKDGFDNKYPNIQKWFIEYDPIYLLSFCAFYYLTYKEGQDPEMNGSIEFYPHYLEIMQALALYQKRNYSLKPLQDKSEILKKEIVDIGQLLILKEFNFLDDKLTDEEIATYHLKIDMMSYTTAIRNWAYIHQMKKIVLDLSKLISSQFKELYGVDIHKFMKTLYQIIDEREELLNKHIYKIRSFWKKKNYKDMIKAYCKAFPENKELSEDQIDELWEDARKNLEYFRGMLAFHSDLKIEKIYSFELDHFVSLYGNRNKAEKDNIKRILDKLSYNFGDLEKFNKDYIILDNPIHHRPFIKIYEDVYYSAIFVIIHHLILGILEDLIAEDSDLRKKYNDKIKPKYLENEVEHLFRLHFPNAKIYRGSMWEDPQDRKNYENDLTVKLDTFALIVEAKSGSVSPPAKRGAPARLATTLEQLIEDPSNQALRFISYLKNNRTIHTFKNKRGEINKIDSSNINYYIPLGVTLAHLGVISSNLKKLIESGITKKKIYELAPSICLTDLESIFRLLPLEAEIIHYLARRREFENHVKYEGDELDLLGFYLSSGFNIGKHEYEGEYSLMLFMVSKELDPYFVGISAGKKITKPELALSKLWKDLLSTLATRKPKNWSETSFILLNFTKDDQEMFKSKLDTLINRIKSGNVEKKHNWVNLLSGPENRRYLIAGYPYLTKDKTERNDIIAHVLSLEEKIRGAVVIGVDLKRNDYPYSVLAGRLDTDLFENN